MNTIKKIRVLMFAMVASMLFISCSKDDDSGSSQPKPSIIGEWFEDASEGDVKMFSTMNCHEDNTVDFWFGYTNTPTSLYDDYSGTYSLDGNTLTEKYVSPITGENTTDVYEVVSISKYTLVTKLQKGNSTTQMSRIVDTVKMTVNEVSAFNANDPELVPLSYKSSDESVAKVDASGKITAIKRGTTYISGLANNGTAVIRVVVDDPNNVIDDFMSFVGGSIDNVTRIYGNNYVEVSGTLVERTYALLDETTENVVFSYYGGVVMMATATLRSSVDSEAIVASFDKKYTRFNDSKYVPVFSTIVDEQEYHITYFISDGMIVYMPYIETPQTEYNFSSANFEQFDNLITMGTADAVANIYGITLTEDNMENGWFDIEDTNNEVFREVSVMFNEDPDDDEFMKLTSVILYTKSGIKQADIEQWYADHYTATGDEKNPYQSSTSPVYYISFKQVGSSTAVYYKFRKNK